MTLFQKTGNYYENLKDNVVWHVRYSNPVHMFGELFNSLLDRERGTEYPLYFNNEQRMVDNYVTWLIKNSVKFAQTHESDLNKHRLNNWNYTKRLEYFLKNYYIYSNESMYNCYYYAQMENSQYQRLKTYYTHISLLSLFYNVAAGVSIIGASNFYFRHKKASIATAFVISLPTFAFLYLNFQFSELVKSFFINNSIRRLGYGHLCESFPKFNSLKRNVEMNLNH